MKKLLATIGLIAIGWYGLNHTEGGRRIKEDVLAWKTGKTEETVAQKPTREKIQLARKEIKKLDADIDKMIRPMAEYTAAIHQLKKDVEGTSRALDENKIVLKTMGEDLKTGSAALVYSGVSYTRERIEAKLKKDFEGYQRLENQLKSKRELLEAKQTSLQGVQDQMAKVSAKKQEFEVRLAQLEAQEETLQIAKLGSDLKVDQSQATKIEALLADIAHHHGVDRAELELRTGKLADDGIAVTGRSAPKVEVDFILRHLDSPPATVRAE